jgi:putative flippase GtrA
MSLVSWRNEKLRFLAVGLWNTGFAYAALIALHLLLEGRVHYLLISISAHFIAVTNAFICQRVWVFRSNAPWLAAYLRFNLVQLFVLAFGLGGVALTVEALHFAPLFGQLLVMSAVVVLSYLLSRNYIFKAQSS